MLRKQLNTKDLYHNHKPSIALIKPNIRGLFGSMFYDFGAELNVFDVNAVEAQMGIISSVSNCNPALVSCVVDDERLHFKDGDFVVFSEVEVLNEFSDGKPRKAETRRPYSFHVQEDITNFWML